MTALERADLDQPAGAGPATTGPATTGPAATGPAATAPATTGPAATGRPTTGQALAQRTIGLSLSLLGVLILGFAAYLYGLSGVQEARSQAVLYQKLRGELGNAVAPVGPVTPGQPVAILDIPSIGVQGMVVVEGTSAESLMLGPGHLRNTPLPGQGGVSVIFGRRATFGAPFGRLAQLRPGDRITAITGQGTSSYTVRALGSSARQIDDPAPNRLLLLTAGSPTIPRYYLYADADLLSAAQPSPGGLPYIAAVETALSGDTGALAVALLWALALAGVSAVATVAALRWSPWLTWLSAAPIAAAVLWNLYQSLAALLPNVY